MACNCRETKKEKCTCASTNCPRHNNCCECVKYHRENGGIPGCFKQ